jgi:hypothetical protein
VAALSSPVEISSAHIIWAPVTSISPAEASAPVPAPMQSSM